MRWNLSVAGLAASWGFIALIVAHVRLDAAVLAFYRVAIAAATLLVVLLALRRPDLAALPRPRLKMLLVGGGLGGHWFLYFETIKLASVAVAVVTVYTAPIFLALLAPLALPESRSRIALAALVPGAAGVILIALGGTNGGHARPLGIACGLGAGITYAILVIGTKQLSAQLPVVTVQLWSMVAASVVLAPVAFTAARPFPRGGEIGYVLLLGLAFTALSSYVYIWLLRRVTAQAAGLLAYLEPVSAALLAWAILGQHLGWAVVVGGLLVIAAGLLVVLYEPADAAAVEVPAARR
jgi:DME family drug/metabolite transporter